VVADACWTMPLSGRDEDGEDMREPGIADPTMLGGMMEPFNPNNAEHERIVRNAADTAWQLCSNAVEAAQQALLDHGIGLAPMSDLGDLLIDLQEERRLLVGRIRRGRG
jgi:hypothetical protein